MGLIAIGPVAINHGDPKFSTSARPGARGIRSLAVSGSCSWAASDTLEELVANENQITIHGHTGILAWLTFDDSLMGSRTGDYIIDGFARDADQESSLTEDDVPFTLTAAGPLP